MMSVIMFFLCKEIVIFLTICIPKSPRTVFFFAGSDPRDRMWYIYIHNRADAHIGQPRTFGCSVSLMTRRQKRSLALCTIAILITYVIWTKCTTLG